jgi:hypothetical protein
MTRIVLMGTLNREWNVEPTSTVLKAQLAVFKETYQKLVPHTESIQGMNLLGTHEVDGPNGDGGDQLPAIIDFRLSESGLTAQRWDTTPTPVGGRDTHGESPLFISAVKFNPVLRAQFCLVFSSVAKYRAHWNNFSGVYRAYFEYVIAVAETKKV